jgi:RNA polymerase sigma-70 factor (ECF subfamily)
MTLPGRRGTGVFSPTEQAGDDLQIVAAASTDPTQFAPLYERYFPRIYAYCLRRLGSAQEAEDVTSQVFVCALSSLQDYRGGLVAAWLFRIARNAVLNHCRDRRSHCSLDRADLDPADTGPTPIERLVQVEEQQILRTLIATLPEDQQDLLALKLVAGLTSEEIGAVMGKSAGAVRVEVHRIIHRLRMRFAEIERGTADERR